MYCIAQTAVLIFGSNVYLRCSELLYVISLEDGMLLLLQMLAVGFVIFNLFLLLLLLSCIWICRE